MTGQPRGRVLRAEAFGRIGVELGCDFVRGTQMPLSVAVDDVGSAPVIGRICGLGYRLPVSRARPIDLGYEPQLRQRVFPSVRRMMTELGSPTQECAVKPISRSSSIAAWLSRLSIDSIV